MPARPATSPSATSISAIASRPAIYWRSSRYPELDAQIAQNEATLEQLKSALDEAKAGHELARVTWGRDEPLVNKGWVTQQQGTVDVQTVKSREAAVAVAQHNVTAQQHLLQQLRQNRNYASVVAPFDGVIAQRNVDVGTLVQGNATSGTFMFEIMQEDIAIVSGSTSRRTRPSA